MTTPVVADLIVGPARVFYAPTGTALPDENAIDYGDAWGGAWVELGTTKTPVTAKIEIERGEAMVEQSTLVLKRWIKSEKLAIETVIAELSTAHLALLMEGTETTTAAGAGQVAMKELEVGNTNIMTARAWGFEGLYRTDAGVNFPIRLFVYRANSVINGDLEFGKADYTGMPLRIEALGDVSKADGKQLFMLQKVTAAATS